MVAEPCGKREPGADVMGTDFPGQADFQEVGAASIGNGLFPTHLCWAEPLLPHPQRLNL